MLGNWEAEPSNAACRGVDMQSCIREYGLVLQRRSLGAVAKCGALGFRSRVRRPARET